MSEIIPFGKYKDKPLETMLADQNYIDWLLKQPWFREKYLNIYNIIVKTSQEPAETPAHNRIQMMFLDKAFLKKFGKLIGKDCSWLVEFEKRITIDIIRTTRALIKSPPVDVTIGERALHSVPMGTFVPAVAIEIKPTIGDDFPAVLRQIRETQSRIADAKHVLLVEEFTAEGATKEQFESFFSSAGILVVFLADVLKTEVD